MRTLRYQINFDPSLSNHVRIVVISDAHIGHQNYSDKHLTAFLKNNMEQPNTWLLTLGDMMECVVPGDAKRFQISQFVTSSDDPDALLDYQTSEVVKVLEPYREQLIGMAMGNHELTIIKKYGHNPHRKSCNDLNCEDLGFSFLMRLSLVPPGQNSHINSVVIYGHHGWGGNSRTAGGNLTKFSRALESFWADLYLFGHSHDQVTRQIPRLYVDRRGNVQHRPAIVANVGTFKRTLSKGVIPSWEESMGFPPRTLAGIVLKVYPRKQERPIIKVE